MFTEELMGRAEGGDIQTLVELDARGFLIGADESLDQYVTRLRCLQGNIEEMDGELTQTGRFEVEGVELSDDDRIPEALFERVKGKTEELFRFTIDWVPGFFINPSQGWLFGGCAFYFYPDFFALFIIRRSFANRERWLIYSRDELLAHELCHVARIAMESDVFEETFAYRTATSPFRRAVGSVFRSPMDSYLLLGSTLVLLIAQLVRVLLFHSMPIWPFWGLVLLVVASFAGRQQHGQRVCSAALRRLSSVNEEDALAVLFRCSDEEVLWLSRCQEDASFLTWMAGKAESSVRWQVIRARFFPAVP
ncbi:MAG: hypothetical protein HN742_09595 [Lentisphaerae bacterium]|jgi:hypothetical protein|nr:hypothetical protein [Lentisphaerota bacterium]MBT4814605.1 hypothetical protein [Lentisphaerota bacterium]MBT5610128.1 hypothetical protein [Lentisphaerota bacterium]MBT7053580.1 hypothetical protein [Lentisphaerota bacterium]MBT7842116.1 hypothetical protein [Lentisphaerota bacterium]